MNAKPSNPRLLNRLVAHPARLWALLSVSVLLFVAVIGTLLWTVRLYDAHAVTREEPDTATADSPIVYRAVLPRARFAAPPALRRGELEMADGRRGGATVWRIDAHADRLVVRLRPDPTDVPGEPIRVWLRHRRLIAALAR